MTFDPASFVPKHFLWKFENGVATVTLNRPERKNPLTFESYAELRDLFRDLQHASDVRTIVLTACASVPLIAAAQPQSAVNPQASAPSPESRKQPASRRSAPAQGVSWASRRFVYKASGKRLSEVLQELLHHGADLRSIYALLGIKGVGSQS